MLSAKLKGLLVCPVCNGELQASDSEVKCTQCGRAYPLEENIPIMLASDSPELSNAQKDGFGHDLFHAQRHGTIFERVFHNHRIETLVSLTRELKIEPGHPVLDLGCNTGPVMVALLREGIDVIGIDIVTGDVKQAKANLKELNLSNDNLAVADGTRLPFRDGVFDVVLLIDVLEHVSRPERIAQEAKRALRPGGLVIATVPWAYHPLVKFTIVRKMLSSRKTIDQHPDAPFTFDKLKGFFPDLEPLLFRHVFHWVCLLGVFLKSP